MGLLDFILTKKEKKRVSPLDKIYLSVDVALNVIGLAFVPNRCFHKHLRRRWKEMGII